MPSLLPDFEYDIFISYRQKDNKGDHWVTEFVNALKTELEATFKEDVSIYFDENPHDGLHEHHDVNESLREKLKSLIFIPILSRTYCDEKSFAFEHEFKEFVKQASQDKFGLKVKLASGNVAGRVLPVRIHELGNEDVQQFESVTGSPLRPIEFVYKEPGVNRPLKPSDGRNENLNHTDYRNQVNKVANAINDILFHLVTPSAEEQKPATPRGEVHAEHVRVGHRVNRVKEIVSYLKVNTTILMGISSIVLLILLLTGYWRWGRDTQPVVEYIPIEFKNPFRYRSNWGVTLGLSHDGKKILYFVSNGGQRDYYLYNLETGITRNIAEQLPSCNSIDFSPQDDSVVARSTSWMGQLYALSLSTGQYEMIADSASGQDPSWTAEGWIYYVNIQGNLMRVKANGDQRQVIVMRDSAWEIPNGIESIGREAIIYPKRPLNNIDPSQAELILYNLRTRRGISLGKGIEAVYNENYSILIIAQSDGSLMAAKFDSKSLKVEGEFVRVLEGVQTRHQGYYVGATLSISNQGDLIYNTREGISHDEIVWMNRKGIESRERLSINGWSAGLTLSQDNQNILVSVHTDYGTAPNIYLVNLADGSEQKVSHGNIVDYSPNFVSLSKAMTFVGSRNYQNWDLYYYPLDGSRGVTKIFDRPGDIQDPHYTRDERRMVFTERDVKGQLDVRVHHFEGDSATVDVASTKANESSARFSPSGDYVAYVSDETGKSEVYVVPYPNPNNLRWQISQGGGYGPAWSHDGNELFYRTPADELVSVMVRTTGAFTYRNPVKIFSLNGMVWNNLITNDDSTFILVAQDIRAPGQVILIKNWMQEVREKLEKSN